jgi:hypothetical protein
VTIEGRDLSMTNDLLEHVVHKHDRENISDRDNRLLLFTPRANVSSKSGRIGFWEKKEFKKRKNLFFLCNP